MKIVLFFILVYLYSSLPFGLIISQLFYKLDIRTIGSGNIGATNIYRELGWKPALITLILDLSKGLVSVYLAKILFHSEIIIVLIAFLAILGHSLSCFLKFKGGKGIATGLGVILVLNPIIALICFFIFAISVLITHYVSFSSILTTISFLILMFLFKQPIPEVYFSVIITIFIIYKHWSNLQRLLNGTENKISFNKKIKGDKYGRL